jgi:hypothetical protein
MVLPLSAVLVYSVVGPSMSRAAVGTMMLTVPLAARCQCFQGAFALRC